MTKQDAMTWPQGTTLYNTFRKDSKGHPIKCRINGKCKTWKKQPEMFRLPVKYGLRDCFYIDKYNAEEWGKEES